MTASGLGHPAGSWPCALWPDELVGEGGYRRAAPFDLGDDVATLFLVRHGSTPATGKRLGGWTPGVDLNDDGVREAEAAATRLAHAPIVAVYASPLERTRQTAKILARPHRLRVRTRQGLGEVDYGRWTDEPLGTLRRRKLWDVVQATPSRMTFPGGESIRAAQARAVDTTEQLARLHAGETVVCVSHADVIKAVVAHHLAMPLDAFQRLVIAPASVTVLRLPDRGHPSLLCFNDTGGEYTVSPKGRSKSSTTHGGSRGAAKGSARNGSTAGPGAPS